MDEAAVVREGAREVLRDVSPAGLRQSVYDVVDNGWEAPGVVTLFAARRAGADGFDSDIRSRAIGVQLIYEGLALTRRLAWEEPWTDSTDGYSGDPNIEVLVADVLVSRGSNLLAYTEAAGRCVEVIRDFGRRQTGRDVLPADHELEADVMALAAVAGTTAMTSGPATRAVEWAETVSSSFDGGDLPDAASLLARAETVAEPSQAALANESRGTSTDP